MAGAGAFQRAHRAIFAIGGARQYPRLPAAPRGAVFSFAAAASAAALAETADRLYAQEHVAKPGGGIVAGGFGGAEIPEDHSGQGRRDCDARAAVHWKHRARIGG